MKIGVIGLGAMGKPMARNAAADGDHVLAFDIDPAAIAQVTGPGINAAASVAEVAGACELLLVMVWDDAALRQVIFGKQGILASGAFRGCVVDLSTTSVALAREIGAALEQGGASFLDAAVIGGGVPAAKAGTSPIVVSGPRAAFDRYAAVLGRLGHCDYVGRQGAAKTVKVINNLLVGVVTAANAEALSLGVAAGLRLPDMVEALQEGHAASTVLKSYMGRYVAEGRYGEGLIGHTLMAKDLSLACELAQDVDHPSPFAEMSQQFYLAFAQSLGAGQMFPSAYDHFRRVHAAPKFPLLETSP